MNWSNWEIRYWDHPSLSQGGTINDCFGNSRLIKVRARTLQEAVRKAKNQTTGIFRLRSIQQEKYGIFASFPIPEKY